MAVVGTAKDLLSLVRFQPSLLKHENSQSTYKRMEKRSQMNTGSAIETERLFLLPSRTDRDSEAFLQMLRDDGDFYIFCGVSPSEKHVMGFANYFERTDHELCTYSIFPKQQKDKFIGYVGVHREMEDQALTLSEVLGKNAADTDSYVKEKFDAYVKETVGELLEYYQQNSEKALSAVNFCLTEDALVLYYNPYDILPYAAGSPEVKVPYADTTIKLALSES